MKRACFRNNWIGFLIFFSIMAGSLNAQNSFVVSGGEIVSGMGSVSLSAGQLFYQPLEMGGFSINPGVQQPFELFLVNIREIPFEGAISIYPNPASEYISISISDWLFTDKMNYQIIDITGKEVLNGKLLNSEFYIKIDQLASGTYYLVLGYSDKIFTPSLFLKL